MILNDGLLLEGFERVVPNTINLVMMDNHDIVYLTGGEVIHFLFSECSTPHIEVSDVVGVVPGGPQPHLGEGHDVLPGLILPWQVRGVLLPQDLRGQIVLLLAPGIWL